MKLKKITLIIITAYIVALTATQSLFALTLEEERKLGKETSLYLRQHLNLVSDPLSNTYLNNLGYRLVSWSNKPSNNFQFYMIDDSDINAFAMFGSVIGINSGLLLTSETESELAAVMAHEIAHDTQRHLAQFIESMQQQQKLSIPAMVGSLLLGVIDPNLAMGALSATMAGVTQMAINYTRENEIEADNIGMQILYNAGYNPHGMPDFFQRLQAKERFRGSDLPEFLRTHPITENRISSSLQRATSYDEKIYHSSMAYQLIKQRLRVITSQQRANTLVRSYKNQLESMQADSENYQITQYGYALALNKQGKYDDAYEVMQSLHDAALSDYYSTLFFTVGLAEILINQDDNEQAIALLTDYLNNYPSECAANFYLAKAYNYIGDAEAVIETINHCVAPLKNHEAYLLLASAYDDTNDAVQSYYAIAQASYLKGNDIIAVEQLKMALCRQEPSLKMENKIKELLYSWDETSRDFECQP